MHHTMDNFTGICQKCYLVSLLENSMNDTQIHVDTEVTSQPSHWPDLKTLKNKLDLVFGDRP